MSELKAFLAKHGGVFGTLTTLIGALCGPPVLAVLPTKWAGVLIVVGAVWAAFSKPVALPGKSQP